MTIAESYRAAEEVLAANDLLEAHLPDFARLDFGARYTRYNRENPVLVPNADQPFFDGKIWLLTDHRMVSAAQLAARLSKESGFATLVGDITGGPAGGPCTMALMPNTSIIFYFDMFYITDSRGRPLEAGTIPHHFNFEGMDALETVLILINQ